MTLCCASMKLDIEEKLESIIFVGILQHISVGLVSVKYFFLIGVINILLKTLSDRIDIAVPVIIILVSSMTNRQHPCCLHLEYSTPALLMVGSASTILWYYFISFLEDIFCLRCTDRYRRCNPLIFSLLLVWLDLNPYLY